MKREDDGARDGGRAIAAAFLANLGIAVAKFVGFLITGASSMLAESIHSVADTANQGLLFLGRSRAKRTPTADHPFGFGRERYFWAFVVALVLFTGGSLFALFEGEEKLRHPHEIESVGWAIAILTLGIVLEGLSLRTAVRESRGDRDGRSWWRFIRETKNPELPVVLLEDSGAVLGLSFALAGVGLAHLTGDARFDALGSIAIGLLLGFIAFTLAVEMKSLLIGESADPEQVAAICAVLAEAPEIDDVVDLRTEQLAPNKVLVVGRVLLASSDGDTAATIDALSERLDQRVPATLVTYLEPVASGLLEPEPADQR